MLRTIGGVIVGYLVMIVLVFVIFSLAYLALGADGAFKPGSYEPTALWLAISFVVSLGVAIAGGYVSALVAPKSKAPLVLAGLVLVLGFLVAIPVLTSTDARPQVRDASVGNLEAMQNARQPVWVCLVNPFIGAIGVMLGGRLKK